MICCQEIYNLFLTMELPIIIMEGKRTTLFRNWFVQQVNLCVNVTGPKLWNSLESSIQMLRNIHIIF